jgi:predicted nucleic acid-binding protein
MRGFRITGSAGVLLKAKRKGLVAEIKPIIKKLLEIDFRLKPNLIETILELAGEE